MADDATQQLVGRLANLTVSTPTETVVVQGVVFALDPVANVIVLIQPGDGTTTAVNLSFIQDVVVEDKNATNLAGLTKYFCNPTAALPAFDAARLENVLARSMADRMLPPLDSAVPIQAYELFQLLSKCFPVSQRALRWTEPPDAYITVLDEVHISPPWDAPTATLVDASSGGEQTLERVRNVLQRWQQSQAHLANSAPTAGTKGKNLYIPVHEYAAGGVNGITSPTTPASSITSPTTPNPTTTTTTAPQTGHKEKKKK